MILPLDYVSGLVDGEGCFSLNFRQDLKKNRINSPMYFRWHAVFAIVLRADDADLLKMIKDGLACGDISYSSTFVRYQVQNTDDLLNKIIPFFSLHKLYGKKAKDFNLWKEAVEIIARNKKKGVNLERGKKGFVKVEWNRDNIERLQEIRMEMKSYKSKEKDFKWN
ncbi:MAG: LAGLIDADG family homing endonuclease [Candidatus Microgenomates bacterium]|jgi:hypothetical protein